MEILSLRENANILEWTVDWFQKVWDGVSGEVYQDCMECCLDSDSPLPQWYVLVEDKSIIGGLGLITNDFNSRQDLWPWLCALYVEPEHRGKGCGGMLLRHAVSEAARLGYKKVYLCTDHENYYERYGFAHTGWAYHPWDESSRIYEINCGECPQ